MNKKSTTILIIALVVVLVGYLVFDMTGRKSPSGSINQDQTVPEEVSDSWTVSEVFKPDHGKLAAVSCSDSERIILGGDSFVASYTPALQNLWTLETEKPVLAIASWGDTIYAATIETILVISGEGKLLAEWGPIQDEAIITSVSANARYVVFTDAGNRLAIVLDKTGNLVKFIGNTGEAFIIPSPHFDVAITDDDLIYITNPGNSRVEKRNLEGTITEQFGDPGIQPDEFSGCCNPSNIALVPGGIVTSEKGINRIKIIDRAGKYIEMVSSDNSFKPSIPLDIASPDGTVIYGANPADSKLYVFKRK